MNMSEICCRCASHDWWDGNHSYVPNYTVAYNNLTKFYSCAQHYNYQAGWSGGTPPLIWKRDGYLIDEKVEITVDFDFGIYPGDYNFVWGEIEYTSNVGIDTFFDVIPSWAREQTLYPDTQAIYPLTGINFAYIHEIWWNSDTLTYYNESYPIHYDGYLLYDGLGNLNPYPFGNILSASQTAYMVDSLKTNGDLPNGYSIPLSGIVVKLKNGNILLICSVDVRGAHSSNATLESYSLRTNSTQDGAFTNIAPIIPYYSLGTESTWITNFTALADSLGF